MIDAPVRSHEYTYDQWNNLTQRAGWGGINASYTATFNAQNQFTQNPVNGTVTQYDAAGNFTYGGQSFQYDVTGQQVYASTYGTEQGYDGERLRVKRTQSGVTTYFLRSTILGGQVVAEINSSGGWERGYVYDGGGSLLANQQYGQVEWVHQDPYTKSQRLTDQSGAVTAWVELDPWGGETGRSSDSWRQPRRYTSYTRDANQSDEAMHRRYNRWWSRFDQPDPYDGSYDLTNPQSFNRYSYVNNDPVNFIDPSGLCGYILRWDGQGNVSYTPIACSVNVRGSDNTVGGGGGGLFGGQVAFESDAGGGDVGGGGGGGAPPQDGQPPSVAHEQLPPSLDCLANVIAAMRSAWQRSGNGLRNTEAGFLAIRTRFGNTDVISTVNLPNTNQDRRITFRLSDLVPRGATAIAIFHTHPNSGSATPSTGDPPSDVATANATRLPIYVISSRGLNVYDPRTRQTSELRDNTEWQRPCGERR